MADSRAGGGRVAGGAGGAGGVGGGAQLAAEVAAGADAGRERRRDGPGPRDVHLRGAELAAPGAEAALGKVVCPPLPTERGRPPLRLRRGLHEPLASSLLVVTPHLVTSPPPGDLLPQLHCQHQLARPATLFIHSDPLQIPLLFTRHPIPSSISVSALLTAPNSYFFSLLL